MCLCAVFFALMFWGSVSQYVEQPDTYRETESVALISRVKSAAPSAIAESSAVEAPAGQVVSADVSDRCCAENKEIGGVVDPEQIPLASGLARDIVIGEALDPSHVPTKIRVRISQWGKELDPDSVPLTERPETKAFGEYKDPKEHMTFRQPSSVLVGDWVPLPHQ